MSDEHGDKPNTLAPQIAELVKILKAFLACPEIADCAPEDKDPDTQVAERAARAAIATIEGMKIPTRERAAA